jgi:K+-sensing histidine kinase KdpD
MEVSCAVEIFAKATPGFVEERLCAPQKFQPSCRALDTLDAGSRRRGIVQLAYRRHRPAPDQHNWIGDSLLDDRIRGSMRVLLRPDQTLTAGERRLLELLASQAVLGVERARLVAKAAEAQSLAESDRLKSSLLSSVSHDLRTPLVAIKGIATALRQRDVPWNGTADEQMLDTLASEADRLNRLVGNLLDMSRIESGALRPERDWDDIGDIIGGVLARMRPQLQPAPAQDRR